MLSVKRKKKRGRLMTKDRGNQGICDGVAGLEVAFEEVGLK